MAIESQGRSINIGRVGVRLPSARAPFGDASVNPLFNVAKIAAESSASQRAREGAEAAYSTELSINPRTGLPELPEERDAGINIFQQSFNDTLRKNYLSSLEGETRKKLLKIADENYLDPVKFSQVGGRYLDTVIDEAEPFAKRLIEDSGGRIYSGLLQNTRSRFARLQIADAKHNAKTASAAAAENLSKNDIPVGSAQAQEEAVAMIDNAIYASPAGQILKGRREELIKNTLKMHAQNSYLKSLNNLEITDANQALANFQLGKGYDVNGVNIFAPFQGMTEVDRREILSVLHTSNTLRQGYHNTDQASKTDAVYELMKEDLVSALGIDLNDTTTPLSRAISNISDPKAVVNFLRLYEARMEKEENKANRHAVAEVMIPLLEELAKVNGLDVDSIKRKIRKFDAPDQVTALSNVISANAKIENQQNILARNKGTLKLAGDLFSDFIGKSGNIGEKNRREIQAKIDIIKQNPDLPEGDKARLILKAVTNGVRVGLAELRQERNTQRDQEQVFIYTQALVETAGLEKQLKEIDNLVRDWEKEGISPSNQVSLLKVHIAQIAAIRKQEAKQKALFFPMWQNQNMFANTGRILPVPNTPTNRQGADILFEDYDAQVMQLIEDGGGNEVFLGQTGHLERFVKSTGVIPQKSIDTIASMAGHTDTIVSAYNAYAMLKKINGGHLIKNALPKHIVDRLDVLHAIGPSPQNIARVLSPDFDGEVTDGSDRIYGKPGKPLKPKELSTALNNDLSEVLSAQSTTTRGWVHGWLDRTWAFFTHSVGVGNPMMAYGGGFSALPPELRERVTNQYLSLVADMKINPETMPDSFKKAVFTDFLHNGPRYIKDRGDKDQRLKALSRSVENVLNKGDWFIGKYDGDRPRNSGGTLSVSYHPVEMYITTPASDYDKSGREYFDRQIVQIVNERIARFGIGGTLLTPDPGSAVFKEPAVAEQKYPGEGQEWYTNDDIRLLPRMDRRNDRGQPTYQVFLSSESSGLLPAIEPKAMVDDSGELIGEIEHDYMYFDPAPTRDKQMSRIHKTIEADKRLRASNFRDHYARIYGQHVEIRNVLPDKLPSWVERAGSFDSEALEGILPGKKSTVLTTSFYDKELGGEVLVPTIRANEKGKLYIVKDPLKVAKAKGDYILIKGPDGNATRKKADKASIAISVMIDGLRSGKAKNLDEAEFRKALETGLMKESLHDGTWELPDPSAAIKQGKDFLNTLFPGGAARLKAWKQKKGQR